MIIILHPSIDNQSLAYKTTWQFLSSIPNITLKTHTVNGDKECITEIYVIGDTSSVSKTHIEALPGVAKVIKLSNDYKSLAYQGKSHEFEYNGITFSQTSFHVFAGLCAVDTPEHVKETFKILAKHKQQCARMGVYKPRTSPYSFQGLGKACLPYVFEYAGQYGIKVLAMEVTHERQIDEIADVLNQTGHPTGVMLQIGTRNAQNFELLRAVGHQTTFPILFKRGYGISLHESLLAAEYLAHAGNANIIFCLRGVKSQFGAPQRNLVDFCQLSLIKRLIRLPVGIDPSHAVGCLEAGADHINDIFHVSAQGVISGANMILLDIHPDPIRARVDSQQALALDMFDWFLEDMQLCRQTYLKRKQLAANTHQITTAKTAVPV